MTASLSPLGLTTAAATAAAAAATDHSEAIWVSPEAPSMGFSRLRRRERARPSVLRLTAHSAPSWARIASGTGSGSFEGPYSSS